MVTGGVVVIVVGIGVISVSCVEVATGVSVGVAGVEVATVVGVGVTYATGSGGAVHPKINPNTFHSEFRTDSSQEIFRSCWACCSFSCFTCASKSLTF